MNRRRNAGIFFAAVLSVALAVPVSDVCRDLANGVEREYDLEDVNACYECGWHLVENVERSGNGMTSMETEDGAWCSDGSEDDYLELDLGPGRMLRLAGFEIQGFESDDSWVTSFQASYKDYDGSYRFAKDREGNVKTFKGNTGAADIKQRKFLVPVEASAVRIYPVSSNNKPCLKIELFSCEEDDFSSSDMSAPSALMYMGAGSCRQNVLECEFPCITYEKDPISGCETCTCAENKVGTKFESDIMLTEMTIGYLKEKLGTEEYSDGTMKGASKGLARWTDRKEGNHYIVPYSIGSGFSSSARSAIQQAIDSLARNTCIKLKRRTNERAHINFVRGSGCSSPVGKQSYGNSVSIGYGCEYPGTVVHEILHSLGFWHEQSRPDRDRYVRIQSQNVQRGMLFNFQKISNVDSLGSPYDTGSVMHYSSKAFSVNGQPTIVDLNGRPIQTQRRGLSKEDIVQINRMYNCKGTGGGSSTIAPTRTTTTTTSPVGGSCKDNNNHCGYWARIGECRKNPGYMLVNCKKSCKKCTSASCEDKNKNYCGYWKNQGYCTASRYESYMTKNCAATCGKC